MRFGSLGCLLFGVALWSPFTVAASSFSLVPRGSTTIDMGESVTFDVYYQTQPDRPLVYWTYLAIDFAGSGAVQITGNMNASPFDANTFVPYGPGASFDGVLLDEVGFGALQLSPLHPIDASGGVAVGELTLTGVAPGTIELLNSYSTEVTDANYSELADLTAAQLATVTVSELGVPPPPLPPLQLPTGTGTGFMSLVPLGPVEGPVGLEVTFEVFYRVIDGNPFVWSANLALDFSDLGTVSIITGSREGNEFQIPTLYTNTNTQFLEIGGSQIGGDPVDGTGGIKLGEITVVMTVAGRLELRNHSLTGAYTPAVGILNPDLTPDILAVVIATELLTAPEPAPAILLLAALLLAANPRAFRLH